MHITSTIFVAVLVIVSVLSKEEEKVMQQSSNVELLPTRDLHSTTFTDFSTNYFFVKPAKKMNWDQALNYCVETFQTHLATILTEEDNNELFALWSANGFKNMWIGLTAVGSSASISELDQGIGWMWVSGLDYHENWFRESKKSKKEKCVRFKSTDRNPVWHNEKCKTKYEAFACDRGRFGS